MPLNPRIEDWAGRVVWLVGASTGIGRATAERLHGLGAQVVVSARGVAALDEFRARHPGSETVALDATDHAAMRAAADGILTRHGRIDLVMYCAGIYTPMRATAFDLALARRHVEVNYTGALVLLDVVLPQLVAQARQGLGGHISLVSSVAGYRGLPKSLAYGPTKAALINLAETLHLDLSPLGLGISVINPGFVETPLTAGNDFHMPALMTPEAAATAIIDGWEAGRFEIHFPKRFTLMLKALRFLGYGPYFAAVRRLDGAVTVLAQAQAEAAVARICVQFEALSPGSLPALGALYTGDAVFKDPFNEVRGRDAVLGIFGHMFDNLDGPRFVVHERIVQGPQVFLVWDFRFRMRRWRDGEQCIRGGSHLRLDAAGLIADHRDYWDAAEELYEKLPVVGGLMRWLKKRAAS